MKTKIHMQDQVFNKVEQIMKHYDSHLYQVSFMKFMFVGVVVLWWLNS